jgi:hypothetical protein
MFTTNRKPRQAQTFPLAFLRLLLRLASFPCCDSHRCVLRSENDDCRALPRVAAATAQKITLSYVAILIGSVMRSFADEQMHFPSPLCQVADSIP